MSDIRNRVRVQDRSLLFQGHSKNPPGDDGDGVGSVLAEVFAGFTHVETAGADQG